MEGKRQGTRLTRRVVPTSPSPASFPLQPPGRRRHPAPTAVPRQREPRTLTPTPQLIPATKLKHTGPAGRRCTTPTPHATNKLRHLCTAHSRRAGHQRRVRKERCKGASGRPFHVVHWRGHLCSGPMKAHVRDRFGVLGAAAVVRDKVAAAGTVGRAGRQKSLAERARMKGTPRHTSRKRRSPSRHADLAPRGRRD